MLCEIHGTNCKCPNTLSADCFIEIATLYFKSIFLSDTILAATITLDKGLNNALDSLILVQMYLNRTIAFRSIK